jgi:hypothetical protein
MGQVEVVAFQKLRRGDVIRARRLAPLAVSVRGQPPARQRSRGCRTVQPRAAVAARGGEPRLKDPASGSRAMPIR